jgi:hypothetical protein
MTRRIPRADSKTCFRASRGNAATHAKNQTTPVIKWIAGNLPWCIS